MLVLGLGITTLQPAQAFDADISNVTGFGGSNQFRPALDGFESVRAANPSAGVYCSVRYNNVRLGGSNTDITSKGNSFFDIVGRGLTRAVTSQELLNNQLRNVTATVLSNGDAALMQSACGISDFVIVSQRNPDASNHADATYHGVTFQGRQGGTLYLWEVAFSGRTGTPLINTRTAVAAAPVLSFTAIAQGVQHTVGRTFSYNIVTMASTGPTSGTLTLTATLPAGQTFDGSTETGWTCSAAGQVVTCTSTTAIAVNTNGPPVQIFVTPTVANSGFVQRFTLSGGGAAASPFTVDSDTQITVTSPARSAGTVQVAVTTLGGTSANVTADDFTYVAPPDLSLAASRPNAEETVGRPFNYSLTPSSQAGGGATSGTLTLSGTLPSGLTPGNATGSGWTCTTTG